MAIRTSYIRCHRADKTSTLSGNLAVTGTTALTGNVTLTGDLTIGGSMTFGDASVDTLTVNGTSTFSAAITSDATTATGLTFSGTYSTTGIDFSGTGIDGRAIRIGTKGASTDGSLAISSGETVDAEPANNYLFGLFTKVAAAEATSTDELRSAWIRTRVNNACTIGTATGWGYGVCGAEIQLKIYGATINSWQASALWAQLESQGATTIIADGCVASAVLARTGLTATTTIASGGVVAGVTIDTCVAGTGVTVASGGAYYGLYIYQDNATSLDADSAIWISDDVATTGITIGNATTGILLDGTFTNGIRMMGDTAYNPIHIGTKANDASGGLNMSGQDSYDEHGGIMIFGDDAGVALAQTYTTSLFWSRYLITANQTSNTATGAYLQMKLKKAAGSLDLTTCDYSASKHYIETDCAVDVKSGNLFVINSTLEMGDDLTNTAGMVAGIHVEINDGTNTLTDSAVNTSGILIRKNGSSTGGWPVGLNIENSGATTGIKIGTCSTGIDFTGTLAKGIDFASCTYSDLHSSALWSYGTRDSAVTLDLSANSSGDRMYLTQINVDSTKTPGNATYIIGGLWKFKISGENQDAGTGLQGLQVNFDIDKKAQHIYGLYSEINFNNASATEVDEAHGVYSYMHLGAGNLVGASGTRTCLQADVEGYGSATTGNYGLWINMYASSRLSSPLHISVGNGAQVDNGIMDVFVHSGETVDDGLLRITDSGNSIANENDATTAGNADGFIKININGTDQYLLTYNSAGS